MRRILTGQEEKVKYYKIQGLGEGIGKGEPQLDNQLNNCSSSFETP